MTVFQVVFGMAVFAVTRYYYIHDSADVTAGLTMIREPSLISLDGIRQPNRAQADSPTFSRPTIEDPIEISRQADDFFANKQYDRAADSYVQLLVFDPNNVDTYNNLGLTLHYLGRSTEALRKLNEGVAVDPTHQRIWLTLGFVNSQLGNTEQARTALTTAAQMGLDNEIGQTATKMLENLP
ncbi:MAG: tetratricopeptide repeat protein [Gammaproteobacteria bacterium]|nr:tetratricopeptide repeat protein [Gammaproteobacteria bacterium]